MEEIKLRANIIRRLIQVFFTLVIQFALLFIVAGSLHWIWAWLFLFICVVILFINLNVFPKELIAERGKEKKDAKKWDKLLTFLALIPFVLMFVMAGLDYRFGWSGKVNALMNIAGLVIYFTGAMLMTWAMTANKFFSTLVRLQTDRNHTVSTGGPYQYIRHPGYVGYILMQLATPFVLGALWALIFVAISVILFVLRTILEDRTLRKELSGYEEYAQKVKYRLIPSIW